MVVYGDPAYGRACGALLDDFQAQCQSISWNSLDAVRRVLIRAGQIEQGLADFWEAQPSGGLEERARAQRMTDLAALVFHELFTSGSSSKCLRARRELIQLAGEWQRAPGMARDAALRVKIPEGFAFYGLYPEQYILSAMDWGARWGEVHPDILVIGLRSIGTTLSAVVTAALRAMRKKAGRVTVRPQGHPYRREIRIAPGLLKHRPAVLIVDEGPGASGSSMASVAEEVVNAGIPQEAVYFFPGHANPPGGASSPETRHWWNVIAKVVTPVERITWGGQSLQNLLLTQAGQLAESGRDYHSIHDVSGGKWRRYAFPEEDCWPAVCARFERRKFLCENAAGNKILWKFTGLHRDLSNAEASRGTVQRPKRLGACHGYTAFEWIQGTRLAKEDRSDHRLLQTCADYLADNTGPKLSSEEKSAARERLDEMLFWNIKEALGETMAEKARSLRPADHEAEGSSYADGRMAPWEWIRRPHQTLCKIHDRGRAQDHTIIGAQPAAWDVAGFVIEWELRGNDRGVFLEALRHRGLVISRETLRYYAIAYASFQLGQASFCAAMAESDDPERERLAKAAARSRQQIEHLLRMGGD